MKEFDTQDKTIYEAIKEMFAYLGLDKKMDEATFKKLSGKYKEYIMEESKSWQ